MARSLIQLKKQGNKKSSGGQRFEASEHWKKFEKGVEVGGGEGSMQYRGCLHKTRWGGSRNPLPTMVMPIKNVIIP